MNYHRSDIPKGRRWLISTIFIVPWTSIKLSQKIHPPFWYKNSSKFFMFVKKISKGVLNLRKQLSNDCNFRSYSPLIYSYISSSTEVLFIVTSRPPFVAIRFSRGFRDGSTLYYPGNLLVWRATGYKLRYRYRGKRSCSGCPQYFMSTLLWPSGSRLSGTVLLARVVDVAGNWPKFQIDNCPSLDMWIAYQ